METPNLTPKQRFNWATNNLCESIEKYSERVREGREAPQHIVAELKTMKECLIEIQKFANQTLIEK